MKVSEAANKLRDEFPKYSKNKILTCLKIELRKLPAGSAVEDALDPARAIISRGDIKAAPGTRHTDVTASEVQVRQGKDDEWKRDHEHGYMATRGRKMSDSEEAGLDQKAREQADIVCGDET